MNPISFTDAAAAHIKNMLENNPKALGFRLSIKKTGCSGFAYVPDLITEIKHDDIHFEAQHNLPVYVDPKSLEFFEELLIDYVVEEGHGLKQKRLVFVNPKEKGRCGCGESFTLE
ncbi:MAG: iron-sulfur cluster assembly accessory protein [Gammaproteobacteria bacterium]|nr:iron-sulfur cluster assembly accessory protein [Gammaproteobacteria bacterium]